MTEYVYVADCIDGRNGPSSAWPGTCWRHMSSEPDVVEDQPEHRFVKLYILRYETMCELYEGNTAGLKGTVAIVLPALSPEWVRRILVRRTHQDVGRQHICRPYHARFSILCQDTCSFPHELRTCEGFNRSFRKHLLGESPIIVAEKLSMCSVQVEKGDVR
jgi:hypothetical protein